MNSVFEREAGRPQRASIMVSTRRALATVTNEATQSSLSAKPAKRSRIQIGGQSSIEILPTAAPEPIAVPVVVVAEAEQQALVVQSSSTALLEKSAGIIMLNNNNCPAQRPKIRLGKRGAAKLTGSAMFASVDVDLQALEESAKLCPAPKRAFVGDRAAARESEKQILVPAQKLVAPRKKAAPAAPTTSLVTYGAYTGAQLLANHHPLALSMQLPTGSSTALTILPHGTGRAYDSDDGGEQGEENASSSLVLLGSKHPAWSDLPLPAGHVHKAEANATQLRRLRRYLVSLGASQDVLEGWSTHTKWSRTGPNNGKHATWYIAPTGRKLSSEVEVAHYFGLLGGNDMCRGQAGSSSQRALTNNVWSEVPLTDVSTEPSAPIVPVARLSSLTSATSSSTQPRPSAGAETMCAPPGQACDRRPAARSLAERNLLKRGGREPVREDIGRLLSDAPCALQETVPMPLLRNLDAMLPSAARMPIVSAPEGGSLIVAKADPTAAKTVPARAQPLRILGPATIEPMPAAAEPCAEPCAEPAKAPEQSKRHATRVSSFSSFASSGRSAPLIVLPATLMTGAAPKFSSPSRIEECEGASEADEGTSDEDEDPFGILCPVKAEHRQYAQEQACSKARRLNGSHRFGTGSSFAAGRASGASRAFSTRPHGCALGVGSQDDEVRAGLREAAQRRAMLGLFQEAREAAAAERKMAEDEEEDIDADACDDDDASDGFDDGSETAFW